MNQTDCYLTVIGVLLIQATLTYIMDKKYKKTSEKLEYLGTAFILNISKI